ncbi:hypothetical protein QVH35_06515 [Candidatus Nitrosotenuis chungbukensis]|nr:hypothetical protein [Candidatus Nitrosotenuis chungbukensis]WKT57107.1 hypothetical protein QVH35_06515 [Candidatus Nitrosotenuis chungbukensis]
MSAKMWKCYRCNLTFKEESSADLHKSLSAHNVSYVNAIEV